MLRNVSSSTFEALRQTKHFSRNMFKTVNRDDLEKMSREDLIRKILNLQSLCGQLKNQDSQKKSEYEKMMGKYQKYSIKKPRGIKEKKYRYIALKMAYLGWKFDGLQSNDNLPDSIENILRGALRKTHLVDPSDAAIKFSKCGRTDKGVSSFDQVLTLCVNSKLNEERGVMPVQEALEELSKANARDKLLDDKTNRTPMHGEVSDYEYDYPGMLNRVLPNEIRILAWSPLEDFTFSARHNCTSREYRYYFPRGKLDIDVMSEAAKLFCGLNDFRNFCKINVNNCKTYVRRINSFEIFPCESSHIAGKEYEMYYAKIIGSGFVYHQVRSMMSMLFLVGLKREESTIITSLLDVENNPAKPCFGLAHEAPLTLYKTDFESGFLKWRISTDACAKLLVQLQSYWSDLAIKSQMTRELIRILQQDTGIDIEHKSNPTVKGISAATCSELSQQVDDISAAHGVNKHLIVDNYPIDAKRYKRVMERPRGKLLEEHFEMHESKKLRIEKGKQESKQMEVDSE